MPLFYFPKFKKQNIFPETISKNKKAEDFPPLETCRLLILLDIDNVSGLQLRLGSKETLYESLFTVHLFLVTSFFGKSATISLETRSRHEEKCFWRTRIRWSIFLSRIACIPQLAHKHLITRNTHD